MMSDECGMIPRWFGCYRAVKTIRVIRSFHSFAMVRLLPDTIHHSSFRIYHLSFIIHHSSDLSFSNNPWTCSTCGAAPMS